MRQSVAIICPENGFGAALAAALAQSGVDADPLILPRYPGPAEVDYLIRNHGNPLDAVIVALSVPDDAVALIRSIAEAHPGVVVIGAASDPDGDQILAATRAGAVQFLAPPLDSRILKKYLQGEAKSHGLGPRQGKVHCFLPAQGSSGASTLAQHVAWFASKLRPGKILLADWDAPCGLTAFDLGLSPQYTLADAADRVHLIDELWDRVTCHVKGLDVLAAPPTSYLEQSGVREKISAVLAASTRRYDYVFVDLHSGLLSVTADAIRQSEFVYLVFTAEVRALRLARRTIEELRMLGMPLQRIRPIVNRVGSSKSLREGEVSNAIGLPVFWALPNDYESLAEARLDAGFLQAQSKLGKQLEQLAHEIAGKRSDESESKRKWWQLLPV